MFGFGKKKSKEGTEEQLHETMNFGGFGGLKRTSSPGTTEPATRSSGKPDLSILDEVEKYDEKALEAAQVLLAQFRKDTEAGGTPAPKDFFKSITNSKNEYEPEVRVISAFLFVSWYKAFVATVGRDLEALPEEIKKLKKFIDGRDKAVVLNAFAQYFMTALAVNFTILLSKDTPSKKSEISKRLFEFTKELTNILRESTPAGAQQKTTSHSSSSSTNGKPFEDGLKKAGKTIEQVMKEMGEDVAPVFYKKDPNTFSQVANYFYAIFLKLRDNLKQGNEVELDLDVKVPVNMLKSSAVFSKDTATSYITSAFNVATSVFINIDTRDLKAGERLSLVQLTTALIGTVGENCDKLLGMETKKQVPEKNGKEKKDLKQISEAFQTNPNIPDDLKKSLKDITGFFSGETSSAEIEFNNTIENFSNGQLKEKYLQLIDGNMLDTAIPSLGLQEYYPKIHETKQELKNVDAYIDFYVVGVVACMFNQDQKLALTKFGEKMTGANFNQVAAMLFGVVSGAQVKTRKGEPSNHAVLFEFVKQYLPAKKDQTKSEFAEGFKERGIDIPDSALEMFTQAVETLAVKRQAELAEEMKERDNVSKPEQPKQEVKEAPKSGPASFFSDKAKKTKYELNQNFAKEAENIAGIFKQVAELLISDVKEASTTGDSIENIFKHYCYQHVIRYHLQSVAFAQPRLMESTLYYCQEFNRPDLHLVEMVTLAHWRPMLEVAYEELYVPILSEEVKSVEDQQRIFTSFNKKFPPTGSVKNGSEYFQMTDEEIIVNFLEVIPFYQGAFLSMPFTMARNELSPFVTDGKNYLLKQSGEYKQTWVTTTLMFAYDTIVDMKKMGRGIDLEQFPNQGPNFALLMLFFYHQINMDMKMGNVNGVPVAQGMEPRYPLEIIPDVEPVKENMMIAMAGSHVFEELVPDLESSKATEPKVENEEQSEGENGKFSALFKYMEENKDEIAFRHAIKGLKERPIKEKYTDTLDSDTLKAAIVGLELGDYFPDFEQTEKELRSDDKYIDFYAVGAIATAFTQNKELALAKFSEKLANASNTEIAAMIIGAGAMAGGLANAGKTSYHEDLFVLAQEHLAKNSATSKGQSGESSPQFSQLAHALAETAKEIKDQLQWFQEVEIDSIPFQVVKLAANSLYAEDEKDGFDLINGYDQNHKNDEHWKTLGNTPFGKAMFYAGAAIAKVCLRGNGESAIAILPFFRDVADWIVGTKQKNAEELMNFLNVPLSMVYGASKDGSPEFKNAFGKLIEELKAKGQANAGDTEPSPAVRDLMGSLATLTQGLMSLEGIDKESKAELWKQLQELKKAGFTPGVIPEATEESSRFSPEAIKEIKSKMLPWFKNSGVVIDDDVLALSVVINRILKTEKNGDTDTLGIVQKLSSAPVFKELYSTEFGQAVFHATYAIAITLDKEELLGDMIDGYINILNWIINQEERAKKGFYVIYLSALVELMARAKDSVEELKERYDDIIQDFQQKAWAWGMSEGVSPDIMKME